MLIPREQQGNVDIPDAAMLARFDAGDPQYGPFAMRQYEPSGFGALPRTIDHVDGNDEAFLARRFRGFTSREPTLLPGHYYPRIWRNGWTAAQDCPRNFDAYPRDLAVARRAAAASVHRLLQQLSAVFETIEPTLANADVFGPALRHLLILACTEVEAAWRGILVANRHARALVPDARLNTTHYVELLAPMRLNEYELRLALYQDEWTDVVAPFARWAAANPTASLSWYDAYNAAKHDREQSRGRANLRSVIDAVAAAIILLVAQFGDDAPEVRAVLDHMSGFELVREPSWASDELYFPADEHGFERVTLWR